MINTYCIDISKLQAETPEVNVLLDSLHIAGESLADRKDMLKNQFLPFMKSLKKSLKVVVETNYVDSTYRDSYYCYHSSRLLPFFRNCVRISFFKPEFDADKELRNQTNFKDNYLGFLILRPLKKCIGKNIISPEAKLNDNILLCMTNVNTTCLGVKLKAKGFPHASQDGETMTCAQTTIWSLLEYFGNKYSSYVPTTPSEIENTLEPFLFERLMPTSGLTYNQISVALRKFGFGPRIYSKSASGEERFNEMLTCYIESGIPLAVAMQGASGTKRHGHAVVCCGRTSESRQDIINASSTTIVADKNVYFWNRAIKTFVFNDDNKPCYVQSDLIDTASYYGMSSSLSCMKIQYFISPLYSKIYMDADVALSVVDTIIKNHIVLENDSVIRTFLTSTRTFRQHIVDTPEFSDTQQRVLLAFPEPKFVWVTEIGKKEDFCNNKVSTIIVMDATGSKRNQLSSVIYIIDKGYFHFFVAKNKALQKIYAKFPILFKSFEGNLK